MPQSMERSIFPAMISFVRRQATGRDFLGQQSVIQYMVSRCIPSFTNTTSRLRYYSFWAWAFAMLQKNLNAIGPQRSWFYLQKLETAFIMSNHLRNPSITGMPGIDSIQIPDRDAGLSSRVMIYSKKARKTNSFTAVQYRPSLRSLNIVWNDGTIYSIGRFGRRLADAFDSAIRPARGYSVLIDPIAEDISLGQLLSLEASLSLDQVLAEERRVFKEIIEQQEQPNSGRIGTTLLILDIASRAKTSPEAMIRPLWTESYKPLKPLQEIAGAWLVIQFRMYYQLSIEALLHSFLSYLEKRPSGGGTFEDFSYRVAQSFRDAPLYSVMAGASWRFGQLFESVQAHAKDVGLDHDRLRSAIAEMEGEDTRFSLAQSALALQVLLMSRFAWLEAYPSRWCRKFMAYPQGIKASCVALMHDYNLCLSWTIDKAIEYIMSRHVLMLHLGVSQAKWIQTGNFTFKFIHGDSSGFIQTSGAEKNNIGMTANKIRAYVSLLCDQGFLSTDGDRVSPTRSGAEYFSSWMQRINEGAQV